MVRSRLSNDFAYLLRSGDYFDFAKDALRKFFYRNAGSGRLGHEILRIDFIECTEVCHIGDNAGGLYHVFEGQVVGLQNFSDVLACLLRLSRNIGTDGFTGFRAERSLSGNEQESAGSDCLRVRAAGALSVFVYFISMSPYNWLLYLVISSVCALTNSAKSPSTRGSSTSRTILW